MDVVPVLALLSLVFAAGIWVGALITERAAEAIDEELDEQHRSARG